MWSSPGVSLKCGRDNVWDGFYLFVDFFIFFLIKTLWDEMWQKKPESWHENLHCSSVQVLTVFLQGLSHSFNKILGANMDVAITPLVTGDDIVHTEQIRGVWNGNEKYFFFFFNVFLFCVKTSWWVFSFDFDIRHYWWWVHMICIYSKTCIFFFPFMPQAPVVTFEQWYLLKWYFQKSVVWSVRMVSNCARK